MKNTLWMLLLAVLSIGVMSLESTAGYVWLGIVITWAVAQLLPHTFAWIWITGMSWIIAVLLHLPFVVVLGVVAGGWKVWVYFRAWLPRETLRMLIVSGGVMILWLLVNGVVVRPLLMCSLLLSLISTMALMIWLERRPA